MDDKSAIGPGTAATAVIAGASGFVGQALIEALSPAIRCIGLGRDAHPPARLRRNVAGWRQCDLFSLRQVEEALAGANVAVYLVHSMMPASRLVQGRFQDLDLICADNFGRAARLRGVERIIYLGGLIPDIPEAHLSEHLRSRREVEVALAGHGVPLVTLRAGLIIGAGGSSFDMLVRLVRRLPVMLCPAWTQTLTQPIALEDVVRLLSFAVDHPGLGGGVYDVGGPDVLSYRELMALVAEQLGVRRRLVPVPLFSPGFSRLWVSLVTGAPRALVAPLIQSLRHTMRAHDRRLQGLAGVPGQPVRLAVARALAPAPPQPAASPVDPRRRRLEIRRDRRVRSVQRLPLPAGQTATAVAETYLRWLPRFFASWIRADVDDASVTPRLCRFRLRGVRRPILIMRFSPERSPPDRPLFYVTGGALALAPARGRLEFREMTDERGEARFLLTALHDFVPRLPWWMYQATQAWVHVWTMNRFARHLRRPSKVPAALPSPEHPGRAG